MKKQDKQHIEAMEESYLSGEITERELHEHEDTCDICNDINSILCKEEIIEMAKKLSYENCGESEYWEDYLAEIAAEYEQEYYEIDGDYCQWINFEDCHLCNGNQGDGWELFNGQMSIKQIEKDEEERKAAW